jgi:protein-S-isoprenylcysteine O-methyltransferase Ste14
MLLILALCWATFALVWSLMARKAKPIRRRGSSTRRLLYQSLLWGALPLLFLPVRIGPPPFPESGISRALGVAITVAGLLVSLWARFSLGKQWSHIVSLKQDHELIVTGPYRWVRNPMYSGVLLMYLGTALYLDRWLALAAVLSKLLGFWRMIWEEERMLKEEFPAAYADYRRRVPSLIPFRFPRDKAASGATGTLAILSRWVGAFVILPDIPAWLLGRHFELLLPPPISLEFLLLGAVAARLSRRSVAWLGLFLFGLDAITTIAKGFALTYWEVFAALRTFANAPLAVQLSWGPASFACGCLIWAGFYWLPPRGYTGLAWLPRTSLALTLFFGGVFAARQWQMAHTDDTGRGVWVPRPARSSIWYLANGLREERIWTAFDSAAPPSPAAAASMLLGTPSSPDPSARGPNVVLIVVESLGDPLDPAWRNALLAPFSTPQIAKLYSVAFTTTPFAGATLAGEVRELCHARLDLWRGPLAINTGNFATCLPNRFDAAGYSTVAIHPDAGAWRGRDLWYRRMGFRTVVSRDVLLGDGLDFFHSDGLGAGASDAEISDWIGSHYLSADSASPSFIYWLTANAHLPEPSRLPAGYDADCAVIPGAANTAGVCSWYRIETKLLQGIARLALSPTRRPTVFVVVGDHVPPFGDPALRSQFVPGEVLTITMLPRG